MFKLSFLQKTSKLQVFFQFFASVEMVNYFVPDVRSGFRKVKMKKYPIRKFFDMLCDEQYFPNKLSLF